MRRKMRQRLLRAHPAPGCDCQTLVVLLLVSLPPCRASGAMPMTRA
jgi:hypothetical protein